MEEKLKRLETLYNEIDTVLTRSHMSQESYDYLDNVRSKIGNIIYSEEVEDFPPLINLEKY